MNAQNELDRPYGIGKKKEVKTGKVMDVSRSKKEDRRRTTNQCVKKTYQYPVALKVPDKGSRQDEDESYVPPEIYNREAKDAALTSMFVDSGAAACGKELTPK